MTRSTLAAALAAAAALTIFGPQAPAQADPTTTPGETGRPAGTATPTDDSTGPGAASAGRAGDAPATTGTASSAGAGDDRATPAEPAADITAAEQGPASIEAYAAANPWLGAATGGQSATAGGGRKQDFANGTVYWSAATGAHGIKGGIRIFFNWAADPLASYGYPAGEETAAGGGRYFQQFTNTTIYWTPQGGSQVIAGGFLAKVQSAGGVDRLGFPTTGLLWRGNAALQVFERGVVARQPAGQLAVARNGFGLRWHQQGGLNSRYGYPVADEGPAANGGAYQWFSGGTYFWHPSRGQAFVTTGAIDKLYALMGSERGGLGYPIMDEGPAAGGGYYQHFEGGSIFWNPHAGTHAVRNAIRDKWAAQGWERGSLGYPTGDEGCTNGGCYQTFTGGIVYWTAAHGTRIVKNAIMAYHLSASGIWGRLGYPTGDEICNNAGCYQTFTGGGITWGPTSGTHELYRLDARCTYGRVVCADKTTNKLYWVIDGQIQATFDARFGAPGWETADGNWTIFRKEAMSWSVPFESWMPWSQYFHNSGMAIHYSSGFEADGFPSWGSHGCINMNNYGQAEWLFNQTRIGDRVVVYWS